MSTRMLYRVIGLAGDTHHTAFDHQGDFKLRMPQPSKAIKCLGCGSSDVIRRGTYDRKVFVSPIGMRKTLVFIKAPRVLVEHARLF